MKGIVLCIGLIGLGLSGISAYAAAPAGVGKPDAELTRHLVGAVNQGNINEVRALLRGNGNGKVAECTVSALLRAVERENVEILTELFNNGGRRCINDLDGQGDTVLIAAIQSNKPLPIVRILLDNGADVNATNQAGETALMWAASIGNIDFVKLLLDRGANVNIKSGDGFTALGMAVENSRSEVANLLCDRGA